MKNKVIYIRKRDFLESLEVVYETASDDYIKTLYEGLQILYCKRVVGGIDFNRYGGYVKL